MAQTNYTPISLYYSTTASAVPTAANLVPGELAINTNDGKLYYEDSAGVVQVLATKSTGSIGGSNTQVQFNNSGSLGGSSGLTWDGSFLTTSSIKNSALTSGRVTFAGASGLLTDSANFTYSGTALTVASGIFKANGAPSLSAATAGEAILAPEGTYGALLYGRGSTYDVVLAQRSTGVALAVVAATNNIYTGGNIGLTTTPTTSGTGITFPATQSASSNANTLDDYEEGTWSPSIGGSTTYTDQVGYYTKCGNVVTVSGRMAINSQAGNANTYQITNLPFTSKTTGNAKAGGGTIGTYSGLAISVIALSSYIEGNTTNMVFTYVVIPANSNLTATIFGNSADIYFSATYLTA